MKNLDESVYNTNLDESVSDFTAKDLFTKNAITAALATGSPIGAFYEAKRQDALKAKAAAAQANATAADIEASAQAQIELAKAEAEISKSALQSMQGGNQSMVNRTDDAKTFPWKTVGLVGGGLVVATGLFFLIRYFVKKK